MSEQILYSRFSNDRAPAFRIRTDIAERDGVLFVRKLPMGRGAEEHVRRMEKAGRLLSELMRGSRFRPNRVSLSGNAAEFEYLEGRTMEEVLLGIRKNGREDFFRLIGEFFEETDRLASEEFRLTEEYVRIFDGEIPGENCRAWPASDVDLLFSNIILTEDGKGGEVWNVIDYEWTLPFPVPVNYLKWRAVHYFIGGETLTSEEMSAFRAAACFTEEEERLFPRMEKKLQEWIAAGSEPVWKLYPEISPGVIDVAEIVSKGGFTGGKNRVTFYFDRGNGFAEEDAVRVLPGSNGRVETELDVTGVRTVRTDPSEFPCVVVLRELAADGAPLKKSILGGNGYWSDERTLVFADNDPMILLPLDGRTGRIRISLDVRLDAEEYYRAAGKALKSFSEEEQFLKERLACAEETGREILRRMNAARGTKTMRAYRTARKAAGKTDPFDFVRPKLQNHQGIHLHIDHRSFDGPGIVVQGWIYDADYCGESLRLVNCMGMDADAVIERVVRDDVNATLDVPPNRKTGFNILISYESIRNLPYFIRIENPRGILEYDLHIDLDPKVRKARRDLIRAGKISAPDEPPIEYDDWMRERAATEEEKAAQRNTHFRFEPKISIVVPLYNTPLPYLEEMITSVLEQTYSNIELCLADGSTDEGVGRFVKERFGGDERVLYRVLEENRGISENTNEAIRMSTGEILLLADHDDTLDTSACFEIVKAFNEEEDADCVYTDEDKLTESGNIYYDPSFKPDFNLDYLRSNNYICHIFAVRRMVAELAGYLRSEYDGAQDYDFILRCCEKARRVVHVPKSLYHWRAHIDSTAGNPESKLYAYENGRKAVEAHYRRLGISARVEMTQYWGRYRSCFPVDGNPLVSIIIPNRDHVADLSRCLDSIFGKSTYGNYEILILENGSTDPETGDYYRELAETKRNIRVLEWEKPFNYSAINNFGASHARGEYLLFLNNDVEVVTPDWIEEMLGHAMRPDTGAVGAKLIYPDGTLQHVGVILGMGGAAGHMFHRLSAKVFSYGGRANSVQDLSAVTAACMMTKKSAFEAVGGFDPEFRIAFNDVDYCLKLREKGLLIVENVFAELIHYESATRGSDRADENEEKHLRFLSEGKRLREKWPVYFEKGDPYFNPNLELNRPDFSLKGQYPSGRPEDL